ncbi:MAG TPA: OmpA family protein [Thermoanaerobaculales bacterium]|nr:OmpA family protein [Thermoanaerobaculales bacterium]HPA80201.1 OmpA family protein [Thermoanaerobaculales bacterium]HQN95751.1 OmpA family protein [Thermoanaerobaculales bacterium]HQP44364.1 OmpA family protein [Thermoanaerobaculales bacterium]
MRDNIGRLLIVLVAAGLAGACATVQPQYTPGTIDTEHWVAKVDQFVLVGDGSLSMSDRFEKMRKLDIAQAMLDSMNQTIPEFDYAGALRAFGRGECGSSGKTVLVVPLQKYSKGAFDSALANFECAAGNSPLDKAIAGASGDLTKTAVPTSLVIVSDGLHMGMEEIEAAGKLASAFGDNLHIFAVQVGDRAKGTELLKQVVAKGNGGYLVNAAELTGADAMAKFVQDVLLWPDADGDGVPDHLDKCPGTPKGVKVDAVGCPIDSDGDGVADYLDKCPGTPKGVKVDAVGCPLDSDGDGVADPADKCPNTPKGVKVDAVGCPLDSDGDGVPDYLDKCPDTPKGLVVDETGCVPAGFKLVTDILFDTNKWDIKPEGKAELDKGVEFLLKNPQIKVEIQGHTDSTGTAKWNATLSQRRAESVMKYLVSKGVPAAQLTAKGFGPTNPVASNDTPEGRAKNRRVDFMKAN